MDKPPDSDRQREALPVAVTALGSILALLMQYGWSAFIAVLFIALYFGWLPDPHRAASIELASSTRAQIAAVHAEMRRVSERQIKVFSMLTELCLVFQRHDPKTVGTCSYVYTNQHSGPPDVP